MMSEKENKVPKRRFKEFENAEAWKQRKLNEIADVLDGDRGNNYPNGNEFQERGHTLFLSASNVTTNGFMFGNNQYITDEKSNSMGNGKLVLDDIVLTSRGSIGHIAWYNKAIQQQVPFARINSGMLILRSKDFVMPCFVAQFLKSPLGKKQIDLISFGSAQPQLTKKDVSNYVVSIPSDSTEQRKLGVFFDNLDNLITLHQRKLEKMKALKKAYLTEMFPAEGEHKPKLRFAGFTDDWEQRKLGDGTSKIGDGLHGTPVFKGNGDVYFINGNNLVNGKIEITNETKLVSYIEQSDDDKSLDENTILMSINGTIGNLAWYSGEKIMLGKSAAFIKIRDFNKKYIYYFLQASTIQEYFLNNLTGSTIKNLGLKTIREAIIDFPSIAEQIKIGQFFEGLNNLITLHQRKLEKLQNIKKAYLNEMFI
jgi:type I restriction enzyme S subunit